MSRPGSRPKQVSKKRKFVRDGVFFTELNEFFDKELSEDGYTGCNVRVTPSRTEIIIRSTNLDKVVGKEERRIRELTALVQKRFNFKPGSLICIAGTLKDQSLSALVQAQSVKFKLLEGLSVRRAAYAVLKFIKEKGAKGCEVVVSGKLRGQRAKAMKFREGYMIHAGDAVNYYIDEAVKHVHLRQGVLGIKVKIMLPSASEAIGGEGVAQELPDKIELPVLKELPADALLKQQMRDRAMQLQQQAQAEEPQPVYEEYPPMDQAPVDDPAAAGGAGAYDAQQDAYPPQYGQQAPQEYGAPAPDAGYPMPADYGGMPDQGGVPQQQYDAYGAPAPAGGGAGYPPPQQGGPQPPYGGGGGDPASYAPAQGYGAGGGGQEFPQY